MLEGKYWKRQCDVIKAEYMKWRKFHRSKGFGGTPSILDTVSDIITQSAFICFPITLFI